MPRIFAQDYSPYPDERNNIWQPSMAPPMESDLVPEVVDHAKTHGGPGKTVFDLATGNPVTFEDDGGQVTVGPGVLNIQGPKVGVSFNPYELGVNYRDGKSTVGARVNPTDKAGYIDFSFGGADPVKPYEEIQGLPPKDITSQEENAAQKLLREHIEKVKQDPNFRYHPL